MFNKLRNYFEMKISTSVASNVKLIENLKYINFCFSNLYLFVLHYDRNNNSVQFTGNHFKQIFFPHRNIKKSSSIPKKL